MAAPPCPLLGSGITDDTLLRIARFLPTARDLVSHQLTCPRFAAKVIAAPGSAQGVQRRQRQRCSRSRRIGSRQPPRR